nr:helix-turn-helix transcriptional regulator [uncultured Bacteroides sp.]
MSIKDRFKMIMDREKMTAGAFAESIGVAQATISHILGPRNKYPSTEVILRLHQRYNDINLEWLLTGNGNMSNDADNSDSAENGGFDYPLFAENPENLSNGSSTIENRKEIALETPQKVPKEVVKQEIIYKERPPRRITEIRIFFDDNTYETFKPEN